MVPDTLFFLGNLPVSRKFLLFSPEGTKSLPLFFYFTVACTVLMERPWVLCVGHVT